VSGRIDEHAALDRASNKHLTGVLEDFAKRWTK
jgi:hypothetical protein